MPRDIIVGKVIAYPAADPCSISGITYGLLSTAISDPCLEPRIIPENSQLLPPQKKK